MIERIAKWLEGLFCDHKWVPMGSERLGPPLYFVVFKRRCVLCGKIKKETI